MFYKVLFLLVFLCSTYFLSAQSTATMKVTESNMMGDLCKIIIVYETGKNEVIPLEFVNYIQGTKEELEQTQIKNQTTITKTLNKLQKKGYVLFNLSMSGENIQTTLFVLKKEK